MRLDSAAINALNILPNPRERTYCVTVLSTDVVDEGVCELIILLDWTSTSF
jgi:hypothetical protein